MKIEFSFNCKILFLLIFPIVFQFESPVINLYLKENKDYFLFRLFKIFLSHLFFILFILIFQFRNKKRPRRANTEESINIDNDNKDDILEQAEIELKKNKSKTFRRNILVLFALSLLYLIAYINNYYFDNEQEKKFFLNSIGILFEIINYGILSFIILKQRYYRHHLISFSIIFVALMSLFIFYIIDNEFDFKIILYFFVYTLLYGLFNISGKKYLDECFKTPYYMLFITGLFNSIGLILYDIITYFVNDEYSGIILGFQGNIDSFLSFLYFFVELIIKFTYTLGIWLTNYYFTPYHFIISDFISQIIKYYIGVISKSEIHDYNLINIIFFSVVYFINFICSLIFNEIIILKFCKLHFYTKKYIQKREKIETSLLEGRIKTVDTIMSSVLDA